MRDASIRRAGDAAAPDSEHHEYHSAVEVDETEENWRDMVGPALAIIGVVAALLLLFLTSSGYI